MFSIKLTDGNGNEFDPEKFGKQLERQVMEAGQKGIQKRVEGFVCTEHGRSPELVEGALVTGEGMKYSFCCEALKTKVVESLQ